MSIDWNKLPDVLSTDEAAEALGIHRQTLIGYVSKGAIIPFKPGGLAFTPEMLRTFAKEQHLAGESTALSKAEIAERWSIPEHKVRYAQDKGELLPIGKRGHAWVFKLEDAIKALGEPPAS